MEEELHRTAKWYCSYDLYTDNGLGLQVQDDVISFDEFKSWASPFLQVPRKGATGTKRPLLRIAGNKSKRQFKSSTEESKRFVRSLLKGLQANMRDGHCFVNFSKANVVLTKTGEARFKNAEVVPNNGPTRTLGYLSTRNLITEFYDEEVPPDLQHLLDLLTKQSTEKFKEKEELYAVHPSIAPDLKASWMFLKMYEVLSFRIPESQKELIYLKLPYLSDWRDTAMLNAVLRETFDYSPGSYTKLYGSDVTEHKRKVHEAKKFLDFIRNGIAHRLQRQLRVTPSEHEVVLTTQYPLLIPTLQEALFDVLGPKEYALHFNSRRCNSDTPVTLERQALGTHCSFMWLEMIKSTA